MPLPAFLFDQATTIPVPGLRTAGRALSAGPILNFVNALQEQSNWCWAAVSSAVARFFNPDSPWTQCGVASSHLRQSCCFSPAACNVYGSLSEALLITRNYGGQSAQPASPAYLQGQFGAGAPVCVRVAWKGGGAHFLTLYGLDYAGNLYLADPWFGYSYLPMANFPNLYQGGATWTHTFPTTAIMLATAMKMKNEEWGAALNEE